MDFDASSLESKGFTGNRIGSSSKSISAIVSPDGGSLLSFIVQSSGFKDEFGCVDQFIHLALRRGDHPFLVFVLLVFLGEEDENNKR
jgi:hypothetical protein